ncbi:MAG: hypothetical protein Q8R39_02045 [bacterium]|nr:hypothetical protein [bacterium]
MNDSLIHADAFFFTTTVAVVLVALGLLVVLFYLIRIMRDASQLARRMREEGDAIADGAGRFRRTVTQFFVRTSRRARGRKIHHQ